MENFNQHEINTSWVENLALDEINMDDSGIINFNEHLNPLKHLDESSIQLMEELKELFDIYVTKFNQLRNNGDNANTIKIFKISNTVNDFMLFRNSLKLVIARRSADVITIGFLSNSAGVFSARLNDEPQIKNEIHELRANVGPFNNISWRFHGEVIELTPLVKHYLTEFIKYSAR